MPWCGEVECGHQLENQVEANMLGEPQYQTFPEASLCGLRQVEHCANLHGAAVLKLSECAKTAALFLSSTVRSSVNG